MHTGVAFVRVRSGKTVHREVYAETSGVLLKEMKDAEIRRYFRRMTPLDKAGAYAAQSEAADIIRAVKGSFTNVVGFPAESFPARFRCFLLYNGRRSKGNRT